ncbi:glycosyltransferase family 117 protein [Dyadobacter sp.]|uniref:glycosyltransferase family 117 protein n=1 Tax=Dyadobacter sp. TaxID=1914288 RepID=UPI003F6ECB93
MISFQKLNLYTAWALFAGTLVTYIITMERTASFWDCGEFIACAFKLQVPHPPGSPLFLLIGRLFSLLALNDVTRVAYWVNMVSVVSSAFTIFFLFKTIVLLALKLIDKAESELSSSESTLVTASGVVGALAYAWSDSFWFSALEAEVYGLSSFFTAVVIWAAFKWEKIEDPAVANRWLIFIAYLVGLSIGVHLLNLVALPALALIYYFKINQKPTLTGGVAAFLIGLIILGIINTGIIPGLPGLAGKFEIFFVNTLGLPYNYGIVVFIFLLLGTLAWGIFASQKAGKALLNTALLSLAFLLTGYSSYVLVLVRSGYNPPINENDPSDVLRFVSYLKREQYESRPLLYGPSFVSNPISQKRGEPVYAKKDGKYVIIDHRPEYEYTPGSKMLLPRMYSSQPGHPQLYQQMTGLAPGQQPGLRHNLAYMFSHQFGHMYWRYFLWNFMGRESDREGAGTLLPWKASGYPGSIASNRAHNNFFMLPILLGIAGFLYMYRRSRKDLLVLGLLFLLTGLALVFYLNSPPSEPRERDYIYVGSFYVFSMWIGVGVLAIASMLERLVRKNAWRSSIAIAAGLSVPVILVTKGWDNHDRSNRYHSVDFARNLLNSCAPNAILFTGGDNDTFPLWYVQEVEGFRTDVRVCVQTFLGIDWYISQLKRKTNQSEALPLSLDSNAYARGKNEFIPFYEIPSVKAGINLKEYLELVQQQNKAIQVPLTSGDMTSILPSANLFLPVDSKQVKAMNIVSKDLVPFVTDSISWQIGKKDLIKSDLVILDIIASNNWKRPVYFSSTMGSSHNLGLQEYLQLEGYAYRLLPVRVPGATDGYVNSDIMFENMMHKTFWRETGNPCVYYDDTYRGSPVFTARLSFLRLAEQLIAEQKVEKARQVADKAMRVMPDDTIPFDQISAGFVGVLFDVGEKKKALDSARTMALRADENLTWVKENGGAASREANTDLYILQTLVQECRRARQEDEARRFESIFKKHLLAFNMYSREN